MYLIYVPRSWQGGSYISEVTYRPNGSVDHCVLCLNAVDAISLTPFECGMIKQYMLTTWPYLSIELVEDRNATSNN